MNRHAFDLTDREFKQIRDLFFSLSGVLLADSKKSLVAGRLAKILRELGLDTYQEYVDYVRQEETGREKQRLVDALTTNETYFFREEAHFELLRNELIPELKSRGGQISVWSAVRRTGTVSPSQSPIWNLSAPCKSRTPAKANATFC